MDKKLRFDQFVYEEDVNYSSMRIKNLRALFGAKEKHNKWISFYARVNDEKFTIQETEYIGKKYSEKENYGYGGFKYNQLFVMFPFNEVNIGIMKNHKRFDEDLLPKIKCGIVRIGKDIHLLETVLKSVQLVIYNNESTDLIGEFCDIESEKPYEALDFNDIYYING